MHSLGFQSSKGIGAFVSSRDVTKPGWMEMAVPLKNSQKSARRRCLKQRWPGCLFLWVSLLLALFYWWCCCCLFLYFFKEGIILSYISIIEDFLLRFKPSFPPEHDVLFHDFTSPTGIFLVSWQATDEEILDSISFKGRCFFKRKAWDSGQEN